MMASDGWAFPNVKFILNFMLANGGFPRFSPAYVSEHIDRPETKPEELQLYKSTYENSKSFVNKLMILSSLLYFIRTRGFIVISFNEVHSPSEERVRVEGENYFKFRCLISNCSRYQAIEGATVSDASSRLQSDEELKLFQQQLQDTFMSIPYFSICHETLAKYQDQTKYLGLVGMAVTDFLSVTIFIIGIVLPLAHRLKPIANLPLMFLVAPEATARVVRERIARLLTDLEKSFENFAHSDLMADVPYKHKFELISPVVPNDWSQEPISSLFESAVGRKPKGEVALEGGRGELEEHNWSTYNERPEECLGHYYIEQNLHLSPARARQRTALDTRRPSRHWSRELTPPRGRLRARRREPSQTSSSRLAIGSTSELAGAHGGALAMNEERSKYIEDCTPLVRTKWWQSQGNRSLLLQGSFSVVTIIVSSAFIMYISYLHTRRSERNLIELGLHMESVSCPLWFIPPKRADGESEFVKLARWLKQSSRSSEPTNLFNFSETNRFHLDKWRNVVTFVPEFVTLLQALWPFCSICLFTMIYYLVSSELTCWLRELKFQLELAVHFVGNLQKSRDLTETSRPVPFCLDLLKQEFRLLTEVKFFLILTHPMTSKHIAVREQFRSAPKLSSAIAMEESALHTIAVNQMNASSASELMEKLYIGLRIFKEHLEQYSHTSVWMFIFINLYSYSYLAISLKYLKVFTGDLAHYTFLLMVLCWALSNVLILIPARLHAEAKGLHSPIWSLLAIMADQECARMRHMRQLWHRQMVGIDMEGGLALKAFHVRITHLRIIQFIIGSGTLVAFALRF